MPVIGNAAQFSNIYEKNHTTTTLRIIEGDAAYQSYNPLDSNYKLITDLEQVVAIGNFTSNTVNFTNVATGFKTTSNVGIANANPIHTLDIGSNVQIDDVGSNTFWTSGRVYADHYNGLDITITDTVTTRDMLVDRVFPKTNGFVHMTSNVGIANSNPIHTLDIGSNVQIDDVGSNTFWTGGNVYAETYRGDKIELSGVIRASEFILKNGNLAAPLPDLQGISEVLQFGDNAPFSSDRTLTLSNVTTGAVINSNLISTNIHSNVVNSLITYSNLVGDNVNSVTVYSNLVGDNVNSVTVYSNLVGDNVNSVTVYSNLIGDNVVTTHGMYGQILGSNTLSASSGSFSASVEVGVANLFVDTTTSNVGIGTSTPSYTLDVHGSANVGTLNTGLTYMNGHILPVANQTYDIGSPEYKIRDLYVGTNSMWIGDETKIAFENGKMKFKRRKLNKVPKIIKELAMDTIDHITNEVEVEAAALTYVQEQFPDEPIVSLEDLKLQHWKAYTKTIDETMEISDIFVDNDEDYEAQSSADAWLEIGSDVYSTQRISIGSASEPRAILDVNDTGAMIVPVGTTSERPSTTVEGMLRYNSETGYIETYTVGGWGSIASTPTITSFSPSVVTPAASNGTVLTIDGSFFDENTTVELQDTNGTIYPTTNFVFTNSRLITATLGSFTPDAYTVVVTNGVGLSVDSTSTFVVKNPPVWSSPADGATVYFSTTFSSTTTLSASDPDGSTITYSLVSGALPSGLILSGSTISGQSAESDGTLKPITIRASNGFVFTDRSFTIKTTTQLYEFTSHTFTNAGVIGRLGPTITDMRNTYTSSWTDVSDFFKLGSYQGYQLWTVPQTGTYRFEVAGARGGFANWHNVSYGNGGKGGYTVGSVSLSKGAKLTLIVGQAGEDAVNGNDTSGGGGGASWVLSENLLTLYAVAGGGGGSNGTNYNSSAYGGDGGSSQAGVSSTSGGGQGPSYQSGGGAGFSSDGTGYPNVKTGGTRPGAGAMGGYPNNSWYPNSYQCEGGFGGGGGCAAHDPGGGGGYSGGSVVGYTSSPGSYGGTTRNNMTSPTFSTHTGQHGYIKVTFVG